MRRPVKLVVPIRVGNILAIQEHEDLVSDFMVGKLHESVPNWLTLELISD